MTGTVSTAGTVGCTGTRVGGAFVADGGGIVTIGGGGSTFVTRRTGTVGVFDGKFGALVGVPTRRVGWKRGGTTTTCVGRLPTVGLGRVVGGMRVGVLGIGLIGGFGNFGWNV